MTFDGPLPVFVMGCRIYVNVFLEADWLAAVQNMTGRYGLLSIQTPLQTKLANWLTFVSAEFCDHRRLYCCGYGNMMIARWHNLANTSPDDAGIIEYLWILPATDPGLGMMDFFSGVPCPGPATEWLCSVQFCIYFPSSASTRQSINIKFLCVFCKEQYLHCYICLHSWPPITDRRTSIQDQAWTRSQYSCCCFFMLMQ